MKTKYTMLFKDWLIITTPGGVITNKLKLNSAFVDLGYTNDMAVSLLRMIESVYNYYEIVDEEEMYDFMLDTFKTYKDYYKELIDNYSKEYDYAANNKHITKKNDTLEMNGSSNINTSDDAKHTEIQLPNKVVPTTYEGTPSSINKDATSGSQDKVYDNSTLRETVTETEFNNELIDLKNKYMNQIRNVYKEFANKFVQCFYITY